MWRNAYSCDPSFGAQFLQEFPHIRGIKRCMESREEYVIFMFGHLWSMLMDVFPECPHRGGTK